MAAHTPAVQHHNVAFPLELVGAAIIGAVVMFGTLVIAGHPDLLTAPWMAAEHRIPAETGMLIQRHGEQGVSWVSPAVQAYRAGEIAIAAAPLAYGLPALKEADARAVGGKHGPIAGGG